MDLAAAVLSMHPRETMPLSTHVHQPFVGPPPARAPLRPRCGDTGPGWSVQTTGCCPAPREPPQEQPSEGLGNGPEGAQAVPPSAPVRFACLSLRVQRHMKSQLWDPLREGECVCKGLRQRGAWLWNILVLVVAVKPAPPVVKAPVPTCVSGFSCTPATRVCRPGEPGEAPFSPGTCNHFEITGAFPCEVSWGPWGRRSHWRHLPQLPTRLAFALPQRVELQSCCLCSLREQMLSCFLASVLTRGFGSV